MLLAMRARKREGLQLCVDAWIDARCGEATSGQLSFYSSQNDRCRSKFYLERRWQKCGVRTYEDARLIYLLNAAWKRCSDVKTTCPVIGAKMSFKCNGNFALLRKYSRLNNAQLLHVVHEIWERESTRN